MTMSVHISRSCARLTHSCHAAGNLLCVLSDTVHTEPCDDVHPGVRSTPDQCADSVLLRGVECSGDKHERWRDCAFQAALQSPQHHQTCPVVRKCDAEDDNSPAEDDDTKEFADMELLHQVVPWKLADHVREVENRTKPVELLTHKPGIFSQTEDSHSADASLVCLLSAVTDPHEREKPEVNLPAQLSVVRFRVFFCDISDDAIAHVNVQWDDGLHVRC